MTGITKKLISSLLIAVLALSLFGCNNSEKYRKAAEAVGTTFCEAVLLGDTGLLMNYINDPEISEDTLKELIHPSDLNPEQEAYLGLIKDSTSYNVDYSLYDKELNMVTVSVSWKQCDFYSEEAQTAATVQDFSLAVSEASERIFTDLIEVDVSGVVSFVAGRTEPPPAGASVVRLCATGRGISRQVANAVFIGGEELFRFIDAQQVSPVLRVFSGIGRVFRIVASRHIRDRKLRPFFFCKRCVQKILVQPLAKCAGIPGYWLSLRMKRYAVERLHADQRGKAVPVGKHAPLDRFSAVGRVVVLLVVAERNDIAQLYIHFRKRAAAQE